MHNEHDRDRQSPSSSSSSERGRSGSGRSRSGSSSRSRSEIGSGSESVRNSGDISRRGAGGEMSDDEMADLQREGNLGNERNRNEPDSER